MILLQQNAVKNICFQKSSCIVKGQEVCMNITGRKNGIERALKQFGDRSSWCSHNTFHSSFTYDQSSQSNKHQTRSGFGCYLRHGCCHSQNNHHQHFNSKFNVAGLVLLMHKKTNKNLVHHAIPIRNNQVLPVLSRFENNDLTAESTGFTDH